MTRKKVQIFYPDLIFTYDSETDENHVTLRDVINDAAFPRVTFLILSLCIKLARRIHVDRKKYRIFQVYSFKI